MACNQAVRVQSPPSPLHRAAGPTGRLRLREAAIGVRVPGGPLTTGSWSNGTIPARQAGDPGSTPGGSTARRKVAGYGWPGRSAKAALRIGDEGSNPLPSAHAPMVKRTSCLVSTEAVRVRLLLGVLDSPVVQWPGRPRDMGKIGGSTPPGTTICYLWCSGFCTPGCEPGSEGSTPFRWPGRTTVPTWLESERRRSRKAVYAGANPVVGSRRVPVV